MVLIRRCPASVRGLHLKERRSRRLILWQAIWFWQGCVGLVTPIRTCQQCAAFWSAIKCLAASAKPSAPRNGTHRIRRRSEKAIDDTKKLLAVRCEHRLRRQLMHMKLLWEWIRERGQNIRLFDIQSLTHTAIIPRLDRAAYRKRLCLFLTLIATTHLRLPAPLLAGGCAQPLLDTQERAKLPRCFQCDS